MLMASPEGGERWVKHYASFHQTLLVGEGDFSFALSLARSFRSASNIVATSLDSYGSLIKKYKNAKSHLEELKMLEAALLHGVDATEMKLHPALSMCKFDRVIFNFPHAGFHGKEEDVQMINMHRNLVLGFMQNAAAMLKAGGEVHVSHKTTYPFDCWNLEELASLIPLVLVERADFNAKDYPGYNNKRGDGSRSDEPFPLGECCTFKFVISSVGNRDPINHHYFKRPYFLGSALDIASIFQPFACQLQPEPQPTGLIPSGADQCSTFSHFQPYLSVVDGFSSHMGSSVGVVSKIETVSSVFEWFLNHIDETNGKSDTNVAHHTRLGIRRGYEKYVSIYGAESYRNFSELLIEFHQLAVQRLAWLEKLLTDN